MDLRVKSLSFWAVAIAVCIGAWVMSAPGALDLDGAARTNDHIVGPLIVSFAVVALWEVVRGVRLACVPLGLWLLVAPWLFGYDDAGAIASDMTSGAALIVAVALGGRTSGRFGGGWTALARSRDATLRLGDETS
jgi:hypothetical protein